MLKTLLVSFWIETVFFNVRQVSGRANKGGCRFDIPYELIMNPAPRGTPLFLGINIHIIGLRDVADSGGSFGLDVEYALIVIYPPLVF